MIYYINFSAVTHTDVICTYNTKISKDLAVIFPIFLKAGVVWVTIAVLTAVCASADEVNGPVDSPSRIIDGCMQQLSSLRSFYCEFNLACTHEGVTLERRYEYARTESTQTLKHYNSDGTLTSWEATDGKHGFSVAYDQNEASFPAAIRKTNSSKLPVTDTPYTPLVWLGCPVYDSDVSLPTLLSNPSQYDLQESSCKESPCALLIHQDCPSIQGGSALMEVTFSRLHHGVPKDWKFTYPGPSAECAVLRKALGEVSLRTLEFRDLDDELLGERRSLPWTMELSHRQARWELKVLSARWNPPLDPSTLIPTGQPATKMIDATVPGSPRVSFGSNQAAHERQKQLRKQLLERRNASASGTDTLQPITAVPTTTADKWRNRILYFGMIALTLCTLISAWSYWRRYRS